MESLEHRHMLTLGFIASYDDNTKGWGYVFQLTDPYFYGPQECSCECSCNPDGTSEHVKQFSGVMEFRLPFSDTTLVYAVDSNPHPIVYADIELDLTSGTMPATTEATFTLQNASEDDLNVVVTYDTSSMSDGDVVRFSTQFEDDELDTWADGAYEWTLTLDPSGSSPAVEFDEPRLMTTAVVNKIGSAFGNRWWVDGFDRLALTDAGATLLYADSQTVFYPGATATVSTPYNSSAGDVSHSTLEFFDDDPISGSDTEDVFILTYNDGFKSVFHSDDDPDRDGFLKRHEDASGNVQEYKYDSNDLLDKIIDATGRESTFGYTEYGTSPDEFMALTSVTDFAGRVTALAYETGTNLLEKVTLVDPDGAGSLASPETEFSYSETTLASRTDGEENVTSYSYNLNRLSGMTFADGSATTITPTVVKSVRSGTGASAPLRFDSNGDIHSNITGSRVNQKGVQSNYHRQLSSDANDNALYISTQVDALGNEYTTELNLDGLPQRQVDAAFGSANAPETSYAYDAFGNVTSVTSADGTTLTWEYGTSGSDYEVFGLPSKFIDELGRTTFYTVDSSGNMTEEQYVIGLDDDDVSNSETDDVKIVYAYTSTPTYPLTSGTLAVPGGLIDTITDGEGNVTDYDYYDNSTNSSDPILYTGWLKSITYDDGSVERFEYDQYGNVSVREDELGDRWQYEYDTLDRLIKTIKPFDLVPKETFDNQDSSPDFSTAGTWSATQSGGYGSSDNHIYHSAVAGTDSATWTFSSLTNGKYYQVYATWPEDATSESTAAPFTINDGATDLTHTVNQKSAPANGLVFSDSTEEWQLLGNYELVAGTTFTVKLTQDAGGTVIADAIRIVEIPDDVMTRFEYDAVGNLTKEIDPLGNETDYSYDSVNRLTEIKEADPTTSGGTNRPTSTFLYNEAGELVVETDPLDRATRYGYDALGRVSFISLPTVDLSASSRHEITMTSADYLPNTGDVWTTDGNYKYNDADTGLATAEWKFTGLNDPGVQYQYEVLVEWDPTKNGTGTVSENATNATYKIIDVDDSSAVLASVAVNQQQNPWHGQVFSSEGETGIWHSLGGFIPTGDELTIKLSDDANGKVIAGGVRLVKSSVTSFTHIAGLDLTDTETDPLGIVTKYDYDERYRLVKIIEADPDTLGGTNSPTTVFDYDAAGQLIAETDPLGRTTTYRYDDLGRQVATINSFDESAHDETQDSGIPTGWIELTGGYGDGKHYYDTEFTSGPGTDWTFSSLTDGKTYKVYATWPANSSATSRAPFTIDYGGAVDPIVYVNQQQAPVDGQVFSGEQENWQLLGVHQLTGTTSMTVTLTQIPDDGDASTTNWVIADAIRIVEVPDGATDSVISEFAYDKSHNLLTETDTRGNVTTYEYDSVNQLTKITEADPDGTGTEYASPISLLQYDQAGQLITEIDAEGRATRYSYDALGRTASIVAPFVSDSTYKQIDDWIAADGGSDPNSSVGSFAISGGTWARVTSSGGQGDDHRKELVADGGTNSAEWKFTSLDNTKTYVVFATWQADTANATDAPFTVGGASTPLRVNQQADPIEGQVFADSLLTWKSLGAFTPDASNEIVVQLTNDGSDNTKFVIADAVRIVEAPHVTTFDYYSNTGLIETETDTLGNVTTYAYDNLYRLKSITEADPDGSSGYQLAPVTTYEYDAAGQVTAIVDPLGQRTDFIYDSQGRQTQVTLPQPDKLFRKTDDISSKVGSWTANGTDGYDGDYDYATETNTAETNTATWSISGLMVGKSYEVLVTWPYDSANTGSAPFTIDYGGTQNVTATVDEKIDLATYVDAIGFADESTKWWSLGSHLAEDTTFTVKLTSATGSSSGEDVVADAVRIIEARPTVQYTYDAAGLLTKETDPLGNVTEYEYDNLYRLKKVIEEDPANRSGTNNPETLYRYDAAGQLVSIIDAEWNVTRYKYDELGRTTSTLAPFEDNTSNAHTTKDDGGVNYAKAGSPDWSDGPTTGYGSDSDKVKSAASETHTATWTFGTLASGETYEVFVTWPVDVTNATDAPFTVNSAATPIEVNQQLEPSDGPMFEDDTDILWQSLGPFTPNGSNQIVVVLGNEGSDTEKYVIADAARIIKAPSKTSTEYLADTGLATKTIDPLGNKTVFAYDNLYRLTKLTEEDPASQTGNDHPETLYRYNSVGQLTGVIDPLYQSTRYKYDGMGRNISVAAPFADDTTHKQTDDWVSPEQTDNNDGTFTIVSGTWTRSTSDGHQGDYRYFAASPGSSSEAKWDFDALDGTKTYEVFVSWPVVAGSAPDAPFTVTGAETIDTRVDQTLDPTDGPVFDDDTTISWQSLGTLKPHATSDDIIVELTNDASSGNVIADAVRIIEVSETAYTYIADTGLTDTATDPLGNVTDYDYDNLYRMIKRTDPDPDGVSGNPAPVTKYQYDAVGQLISVTDPLGDNTRYKFDGLGRLVHEYLPLPNRSGYNIMDDQNSGFTTYGAVWSQATDSTAYLGEYSYISSTSDSQGQWDVSGLDANKEYEAFVTWPVVSGTDHATYVKYYNAGTDVYLDQSQPPDDMEFAGNRWESLGIEQFSSGSVYGIVYAPGSSSGQTYVADAILFVEAGDQIRYVYDAAGNLLEETDVLGNVTANEYDYLNRLTKRIDEDPDGVGINTAPITAYTYDLIGNQLSLTDPNSNKTEFAYDGLNRLLTETVSIGGVDYSRIYQYDRASNLEQKTDRDGRVTKYEVDSLNRRKNEKWFDDAADTTANHTFEYTLDAASQLTSVLDKNAAGTQLTKNAYTFDGLGRATTIDTYLDGLGLLAATQPVKLNQTFDPAGNRTELAATINTTKDFVNTYTFDNLYRTQTIEQTEASGGNKVAPKHVAFTYDDANRFDTITRYNVVGNPGTSNDVVLSDYTFDDAGRLTALDHAEQIGSASNIADYAWTYDRASRVTTFDYTYKLESVVSTDYNYDENNQLIQVDVDASTTESYLYDENGNRKDSGFHLNAVGTGDYTEKTSFTNFPSSAITVEMWLNSDDISSSGTPLFSYATSSDDNAFLIFVTSTGDLRLYVNNTWVKIASGMATALFDGKDHHLAVTWKDSTDAVEAFIDGSSIGTPTLTSGSLPAGGTLVLGQEQDLGTPRFSPTQIFKGEMRDVRIYNTARSSGAINSDMNNPLNPASLTSSLAGAWQFNSVDSVVSGDDLTSNNNDFTITTAAQTEYGTGDFNRLTRDATYDYLYDLEGHRIVRSESSTDNTDLYSWDHRGRLTQIETGDAREVAQWLFNEDAGTTAYDLRENNLGGTLYGDAAFVAVTDTTSPSPTGRALDLDGTDDYVSMGDQDKLEFDGDFSISLWVNADDDGSSQRILGQGNAANTDGSGYDLVYLGGSDQLRFTVNDGDGSAMSKYKGSVATLSGGWHHIVVVADYDDVSAGTIGISLDGSALSTTSISSNFNFKGSTTPFLVGIYNSLGWDYDGKIADVRVYGEALSSTDITDLYSQNTPAEIAPLISTTKTVQYDYDAFDRRVKKTVDSAEEFFVYDGQDIVLRFDGGAATDLANRYLHGPAVDQVLADEQVTSPTTQGTTYWPLADNLGSIRHLIDNSGVVQNEIVYDSFGNIDTGASTEAIDHIFGYTGRESDDESDLQYNRARYYDAAIGRWASEDPIGFAAGDENLYRYIGNGPTNATDPSGLDEHDLLFPEFGNDGQPLNGSDLDRPFNLREVDREIQDSLNKYPVFNDLPSSGFDHPLFDRPKHLDLDELGRPNPWKNRTSNALFRAIERAAEEFDNGQSQRWDNDRALDLSRLLSEAKRRLKGPQRFRYCPFGRFSSKLYTPWENLGSGTPYDSERRNRAPLLVDKLKEAVTGWKTCYAFKMPPSDKMLFEGMTTIAGFGPLIKLGKGAKAAKGVDKANDARQAVDKARKAAKAGKKNVKQMGDDLADKIGKNRVSGKTAGGKQVDIDLRGREHFDKRRRRDIDTPHVRESDIHVGPNGKKNITNKQTRPATKQDIRNARRLSGE